MRQNPNRKIPWIIRAYELKSKKDAFLRGIEGESEAARYLEQNSYRILERRFRSSGGEVDIIVRKGDLIVFVEVKAWNVLGAESLSRAINTIKKRRIRATALHFLSIHREFNACRIRFDLIFLSGRTGDLDHWENAF